MRIWEFEDNKAISSDLVREQDFILRVRRLQRLGTPHLVINLPLSAITVLVQSRPALEDAQNRLKAYAKATQGVYAEMSNGDAFIIWDQPADPHDLSSSLSDILLPEGYKTGDTGAFPVAYHMPKDYTALRERTNHYVEIVREAQSKTSPEDNPAHKLQSEAARGPLTAWSIDQIGRLLDKIDLRHYGRTQKIYHAAVRKGDSPLWTPVSEEYFIGFDGLKRDHFPRLDLVSPRHLFLALCETIDKRLLHLLIQYPKTIAGRALNLNLSVGSIIDSAFTQFAHSLSHEQRSQIGFEIHSGDLFQDLDMTLNAFQLLRREGFKTLIDSVTPDIVNYVNLALFKADTLKINVSKDYVEQLNDPAIRQGLAKLPVDKLIFYRCDSDKALKIGLELGVTLFQGWLIDEAVS